jgi:hypothetical protein
MARSQPWAITGLNASWLIISGLGVPLAGSRSLGPVVLSSTEATWQLGLAASLIGGLLNLFLLLPYRRQRRIRQQILRWLGLNALMALGYLSALNEWWPLDWFRPFIHRMVS